MSKDQCQTCFRTFNPDALARHEKICNKVNTKVRKPMDIQKQRIAGTDIKLPAKNTLVNLEGPKKTSWKQKHEEFIRNIKYARDAQVAEARGEKVAPPPPSQKPADHVDCPTCGRTFNPNAAERHIQFCAEQARRKPLANQKTKTPAAERREKMMTFKSTFDKRKQQQNTGRNADYNPSNYGGGGGGVPVSRTLRQTENKSAPTPLRGAARTGAAGRYNASESRGDDDQHTMRPEKKLLNNLNARLNGGPVRKVSSGTSSRKDDTSSRSGRDDTSSRGGSARHGAPARAGGVPGSTNPPYCYECGYKYPAKTAKFCCECGTPKLRND